MDVSLSSATLAGVIIAFTSVYYFIKNRGVVPGPVGVPYLGLYPYITDKNADAKFEEYKKKYGDIFSFTYSGKLYIGLCSVKVIKEIVLNKSDCFMEKYKDTNVMTEYLGNGVAFANGEKWKILKKFFLSKFKEYWLSTVRDGMEGPLSNSLNTTIQDLQKLKGKPVNIVEFLVPRFAVIIRRLLFGEKCITDEYLRKIVVDYTEASEYVISINMLLMGPIARLLFALKPNYRKSLKSHKVFTSLILESARKVESFMDEEHPTCVIEEFYKERNKRRRENDSTWEYFSDEALAESLLQFIRDGILAAAAFTGEIFNVLVEYPSEQEKIYSEILEVVGPNHQPCVEDRTKLPYINAFMNEFIRYSSLVTFFPSLECTKETTYRGFRIPVGSILLLNFKSANHDSNTFDDPDTFNPSRYFSSTGEPKVESPLLFGIGKRSCAGETFIMLQTFLFLTTIIKNFKIVASKVPEDNSLELSNSEKLNLTFLSRTESGAWVFNKHIENFSGKGSCS